MARGILWLAAALAALPSLSAPAFAAAGRAPNDVFYRCSVKHSFRLPGFAGGTQVWTERRGRDLTTKPGDIPERIDAWLEVNEKDGIVSELSISWVQNGRMGWPYVWRADLHPIYLVASFQESQILPGGSPAFDPASLKIKLEVVSGKKLRDTLAFRFWRRGQNKQSLMLGGPAQVPAWRKSAEVTVAWPELASYAKGQPSLHYELYRPRSGDGFAPQDVISEGRVDLSIIPTLIEEFRKAELALMANVAGRRDCERIVEPEPSEEATI
jgi:hypothetical protein